MYTFPNRRYRNPLISKEKNHGIVSAIPFNGTGNYLCGYAMLKLLKFLTNAGALIGIALICANGYLWYTTGKWEIISISDLLSYASGNKVHISKLDPMFFYNLVN